jgi:hypothetical protein
VPCPLCLLIHDRAYPYIASPCASKTSVTSRVHIHASCPQCQPSHRPICNALSLSITVCFSHVQLALSTCSLAHSLACSYGHSHHSLFRLYTHIVESCTLQSQRTLPRRASVSMGRFSRAVRSRSSPPSVETQRSATGACMCACVVAAHDDVELQCWRQL